ncbi:larval cuticle protein LCP-17-like isoform X2 [Hyposmocoma kahamanoa]|uniref:larval cuticle protein LCP-17-like isoform X2 n=1 Tax=Hyposmocoma kahamanoa TaxID=1477025 RepID=UPI000E6D6C57|nr:larval cuticle protein LCP-17-like isoform X2 [Hyposmocoma kahamanoa]
MKFLVLALCVGATYAASTVARTATGNDYEAPILRSESDVNAEGFNYIYETGNGISAQAHGALKKVDNQDVISIQGEYQYQAPDGTNVRFSYVADENGYQPQSDLLPVAPEIPAAIVRSLEYIAAHPPAVEHHAKKFY